MNIFFISVFIGGILSFFSPCIIPVIPVYISVLVDNIDNSRKMAMLRTLAFISGLSTVFIILGFGAGIAGSFFTSDWFVYISAGIVIFFGLTQMEIIKLSFSKIPKMKNEMRFNGYFGVYVLGLTFSFAWTPCIGPILASVLAIAAQEGSALQGAILMVFYSLGLSLPFIVFAIFSNKVIEKIEFFEKHIVIIKKVGGLIIVIMGILILTNNLNFLYF